MLSVSLQAKHLHSSAGPDIQADDVTHVPLQLLEERSSFVQ